MNIRPEVDTDFEGIAEINRLAFGSDSEAMLVAALRDGGYARLSLVAEVDGQIVGHIMFSRLPIGIDGGEIEALSLAPMAVLPAKQRQGVGSKLVREGMSICAGQGFRIVVVLGHPDFYPRFGFSAELGEQLASAYSGAGAAWMVAELAGGAMDGVTGRAEYPPPFSDLG